MILQRARLATAALAAACGIALSTGIATPAAASTQPATTTQSVTATQSVTTARPAATVVSGSARASVTHQGSNTAAAGTVLFTPKHRPGVVTPNTPYSCTVSYPYVTDTFSNGEISWTATVSCNIVLRMQGTTVLFQWGSSNAYAFGNSYDNYSSSNTSSGAVYGIFSGTWGVNDNVLLFSPPGYNSTPGAGCYYYNPPANTEIKCTETTGPFTAQ
ncbi:MAG TPA: hypothetical protein VGS97_03480 [Actinocrinis sp.]|uniref:hypothetical protein n=1 Tax=Actinocrinis sp. TaxID=1920516 RepID=UPI002DDCB961|nr:hypothetical protein [Actinocrinis sp.]HEV2343129.1 hypothetical protein [Actinocrinis sp.]